MDENDSALKLKLLILGDSTVGKTSLTLRYIRDTFIHTHIHTIGLDVQMKTLHLENDTVQLQIVRIR